MWEHLFLVLIEHWNEVVLVQGSLAIADMTEAD